MLTQVKPMAFNLWRRVAVASTVSLVLAADAQAQQALCQTDGRAWADSIAKSPTLVSRHFTLLVFLDAPGSASGDLCYYGNARDYGVVGDPIYVGVFTKDTSKWTGATFEPCALQSAAPSVLQPSEAYPAIIRAAREKLADTSWRLLTFLPRTCFNPAVDVTATGTTPKKFPLRQYERYRATLNAGILFSKLRDSEFGLRADQTDATKKFIYDKAASERGPEYIATLQLYAIAKYLPSLLPTRRNTGPYLGRDPLHDQDFWDRLGAVLGAGIKNPTKRFAVGASFELIYGVSMIWVEDFAKVNRLLPDVATDQPFTGTDAEIPTRESWQSRGTLGLSVDLRYLSVLFTGNRS